MRSLAKGDLSKKLTTTGPIEGSHVNLTDFSHSMLNNTIHSVETQLESEVRDFSAVAILRAENCLKEPLRPELWQDLGMNEYINHYPGGNKLNLQV